MFLPALADSLEEKLIHQHKKIVIHSMHLKPQLVVTQLNIIQIQMLQIYDFIQNVYKRVDKRIGTPFLCSKRVNLVSVMKEWG